MTCESEVKSISDLESELSKIEINWDEISEVTTYRWMSTLAKSRRTTAELLLCSALASTSAMLGKTTVKLFKNFNEYANLFLIALAPSGAGKTPACMTGSVRPIVNHVEDKAKTSVLVDDTTCNGLFNFYNATKKVTPLLCVDEAYPLLKTVSNPTKTRSHTSLSMERLCKLYDGDYWYCVKGNKGERDGVPSARLSLLAFTTPNLFLADVWPRIIEARNGLADRFLVFYQSKRYLGLGEIGRASAELEEFSLKSFDTVFEQMYAEHNGEEVIQYSLSVDAKEAFFRYSKKETSADENQPSASTSLEDESSSKKVKNGLKLTLVMHVLYDRLQKGLTQQLGPTRRTISEHTLEMALALNETFHTCKGISELCCSIKNPSTVARVGVSEEDIAKSVLVSPGPFCTVKRIYNSFSSKRRPRPDTVKQIMANLQSEGLGAVKVVNRSATFYKALPNVLDATKLAKYQVTEELSRQCFLKKDPKLSDTQREALLQDHPHKEALNQFLEGQE